MSQAEVFHEPYEVVLTWIFGEKKSTPRNIYTWLTQSALDPTNSGRVTMNYLMKLVKTALEWSYEAKSTDVLVEMLEKAASLLVLRRNTLRIIDGVGPNIEAPQVVPSEQGNESKTEPEREAVQADHQPNPTETVITVGEQVQTKPEQETVSTNGRQDTTEQRETVEEQEQTGKMPKCTFPGVAEIDLKRFQDSDTQLVECPGCGRTRTLTPVKGVLRFKPHDKRKTNTPNTEKRWVKGEPDWDVVGG